MAQFSFAKGSLYSAVATATLALAAPTVSWAQAEPGARAAGMDELVITARKREENLQEAPIAVTAIGAEQLRNEQITDLSQIAAQVPSFTFQSQNSMESEMFIRGVGSVRLNGATADPSIGTFLNEVYIGRRGAATPPIFDLARVEVLRGPQGTLFGKNIVGGAINLITAAPSFDFDAGGSVSLGNYDSFLAEGFVSGGLTDTLAGRLSIFRETHDGYAYNTVRGQELEDKDSIAVRGSLLWNATNDLTVSVIADYSQDRGGGPSRHAVDDPTSPGFGFITPNIPSDPRVNVSPYEQYADRDTAGLTGRVEWDLGGASLTYVTAYRYGLADGRWTQAGAGSPPSITDSTLTQHEMYQGVTHELRLASDPNNRFRWIAGVYYLDEYVKRTSRNTAISFLPGGPGSTRDTLDGDNLFLGYSDTLSYAAFGEIEFDILSNLTLAVGGRYTTDEKDLHTQAVIFSLGQPGDLYSPAPLQSAYDVHVSQDWSEFTPRIALNWQVSDNVLLYGSYASGYKGGGWQGATANAIAAATAYDPESASTFEIGFKADWLNNRLRTNLAVFYTDFTDLQVELLDDVNLTLVVANAADAVIQGIEFEVRGAPTDWLTLFASGSLLDAEYKDYIDPLRGLDYSGNQIQRTPDYQYTIGADVRHGLTDALDLIGGVSYSYQDQMLWGQENRNIEDGYGLLNARIGVGASDGRWTVSLWGKNLNNELYRTSIIPFVGDEVSVYGAPRTYGVRLT
ncbi:MAG TPA: TonB-dependent receptor, partial [Terricaulis sp.]|nr:TonB-dependent receptor [Terricaulis sp.]